MAMAILSIRMLAGTITTRTRYLSTVSAVATTLPEVPAGAEAAVLAVEEIPAALAVEAQMAADPAAVGAAVTAPAVIVRAVAAAIAPAVQAAILAVAAQMVAAQAEAGNTQEKLCSRKSSSSAKNIWRNWWRSSKTPPATIWSPRRQTSFTLSFPISTYCVLCANYLLIIFRPWLRPSSGG